MFELVGSRVVHKKQDIVIALIKRNADSFKSSLTGVFGKTREISEYLINLY